VDGFDGTLRHTNPPGRGNTVLLRPIRASCTILALMDAVDTQVSIVLDSGFLQQDEPNILREWHPYPVRPPHRAARTPPPISARPTRILSASSTAQRRLVE
jgi:hypothetical protein